MKELDDIHIDKPIEEREKDNILSDENLKYTYMQNFPAARHYIISNSGSTDDAKDFYQEAYIAFWRNVQLGKFILTSEKATSAYILTILKHKWIDHLRKNNLKIIDTDLQDTTVINLVYEQVNNHEATYIDKIVAALKTTGQPCKDVLLRFYYLKETLKSIAHHYNWTEATAKNNKYRCLQKLRANVLSTI